MRLVFLNGPYRELPYSRASRSPAVTKSGTIYYPLGLGYAAGLAQAAGLQVDLVDAVARGLAREEVVTELRRQGADLILIDTSTPSIHEDVLTAGQLKQALPQAKIFLVGTHATALPEETLHLDRRIDGVLRGEYDQTAIELARMLAQGGDWDRVSGLSFRQGDAIIHNPDRDLIQDLDQFPFFSEVAARHLRLEDYFFAAARFPMLMLNTARGCPHRCGWCLYPQVMHRGKYRARSPENVAAEFAWIARELPQVREVGIEDDLFTADRGRVRRICELLISQGNPLPFWCDTRVDLDLETMRRLKAAGCRLLIAGFESGEQAILNEIGKGTRVEQAYEFMENARRARLLVHGCFVLGNPGETRASMAATLELAKRLGPDTAQFFPMMVYPGTSMFQWAQGQGYLQHVNYREWLTEEGMHNSIIDLPGLPGSEVMRFCAYARREFYLRRGYVLHKLAQSIRSPVEARRNIKAFYSFARHLVRS